MTAQALEKSKKFRNLRSKRKLLHKTSRKSMSQVEYEMKERSLDPDSIGRSDVWLEAYGSKNKDGVEDVEDAEIVQQVKKLKLHEASSSVTDDAVAKVVGPERRWRVRGLGFGALPSKVDGQAHASNKYSKLEQEVNGLKLSVQRILSKLEKEDENNGNDNIPLSSGEHSNNKNKNAPVQSAKNVSVCGKKRKEPGSSFVGNHQEASQVPSMKKLHLLSWLDA